MKKSSNEQLIERAEKLIKSVGGYRYSPGKLAEIISAGYNAIPNGACLAIMGTQRVTLVDDHAVCKVGDDVTKTTPISTDAARDAVLVQYGVMQSQLGSSMGSF